MRAGSALGLGICSVLMAMSFRLGFCEEVSPLPRVQDIVAYAKPAVVFIRHRDASGNQYTGTGFLVFKDGDVLTCAHVVEPKPTKGSKVSDKIWVRMYDGTVHEARLLECDTDSDTALIRIAVREYPFLDLDTSVPSPGEDITVIGFPLGELLGKEPTVTKGVISALRFSDTAYQLGADVNPGNSGGPVLNKNGDVLGVVSFKVRGAEGICFAVASSLFQYPTSKMVDGKECVAKDGMYVPKEWLTPSNPLHSFIESGRESHITHNTRSPLHRAADAGDLKQVQALLASGFGVDARDADGETPLYLACYLYCAENLNMDAKQYDDYLKRKLEVASLLISKGANINATDESGDTPLYSAVGSRDSAEFARLLLANGANAKLRGFREQSVLISPIIWRNSETLRLLLQHGADASARDSIGRTPLGMALSYLEDCKTEEDRRKLQAEIDILREYGGKE